MGLVHIHHRVVAFRGGVDFGKIRDVAGHAENAIENHHAPGFFRQALQAVFQRTGGVVAKGNQFSRGEIAAIDDARVVLTVAKNGITVLG